MYCFNKLINKITISQRSLQNDKNDQSKPDNNTAMISKSAELVGYSLFTDSNDVKPEDLTFKPNRKT